MKGEEINIYYSIHFLMNRAAFIVETQLIKHKRLDLNESAIERALFCIYFLKPFSFEG